MAMPHSKTAVVAYLATAVATGLIERRLRIAAGLRRGGQR